ncbi:MAG TPA: carboxypeptidase-like regulatory domain-containing protein [Thermoanaerobaculia bacterium]|nr:carboxypeptidase-like regulatory domain-containing protein [Thermoanaerobaculia bacterium]
MVLRRWIAGLFLIVLMSLMSVRAWGQGAGPGEVSLPLADYLALAGRAEAAEKERAERAAGREAPVAEVTAQRVSLVAGEEEAEVTSELEVLVQGHPSKQVFLPLAGIAERVEVTPATAALTATEGGAMLVTPGPGKYLVRVHGRLPVARAGGVGRLPLAPVVAPVAEVQADLPADAGWSSPGTVVVEEREQDGRRRVRLAAQRGKTAVLELRRRVDGSDADRLLARAVVLTLFQLRPDGARRHDVVLYEVARGGLASFAVELPPGLEVEQVGTDEGAVVPLAEARRLTVHRQKQLQGAGYLVLTSTPPSGVSTGQVPFAFALPGVEVRARYLALASSVAADVQPVPEKSWARVDLDDLPAELRGALGGRGLSAAWRLLAPPAAPAASAGLALAVAELPKAPELEEVVRARETMTLVTLDGTVLHRDLFTVEGGGEVFDLTLPAGATLWSARVGEQPVRPVERGGRLSVPLGFQSGLARVEVVSVLPGEIPEGRSRLALELARVEAPVLDHRWRLLLPEGARYRFRDGDLLPAWEMVTFVTKSEAWQSLGQGQAGVRGRVRDEKGRPLAGATVTLLSRGLQAESTAVTGADGGFAFTLLAAGEYEMTASSEGHQPEVYRFSLGSREVRPAYIQLTTGQVVSEEILVSTPPSFDTTTIGENFDYESEVESLAIQERYFENVALLSNGLVGGVKPLPVTIPETGKVLILTGVLPPERVAAELEVRAKR